jgi:hypothetical protein
MEDTLRERKVLTKQDRKHEKAEKVRNSKMKPKWSCRRLYKVNVLPTTPLRESLIQAGFPKVVDVVVVLEGDIGRLEISPVQGITRHLGKLIPINGRLLTALAARRRQLVVGEAVGEVFDERVTVGQVAVVKVLCPGMAVAAVLGPGDAEKFGVLAVVGYPDDSVLPFVSMAGASGGVGGLVLGHVPGVHDGHAVGVFLGAGVDLAFVVFALAIGRASVLKTTAVDAMLDIEIGDVEGMLGLERKMRTSLRPCR